MRTPKALSYSGFSLCEKQPEEFYLKYLTDNRPEREPQTPPMCVGSGFDAYVKAALHSALFGPGSDPRYEFSAIFESQVEKHNWDFALRAGKHVFRGYRFCGAFDALLAELEKSTTPPRFEFTLSETIGGVPITGKPDCEFKPNFGEGIIDIVDDWKVHGYCSKYGASPTKGYQLCLDCFPTEKHTRSHGREHGLYLAKPFRGMVINAGCFESCSKEYANQLCLYGWLLGKEPGDENVVFGIEEIVAKFMGEGNPPQLRYARHRSWCTKEHQLGLLKRLQTVWERCTSGHFFTELSLEDSKTRCEVLDQVANGAAHEGESKELADWFDEVSKEVYRG